MEQELYHYQFINTLTGNIIAYRSVPADLAKQEHTKILERKREELAASHTLDLEQIYWQDQDHPIL
jgi:hypothetical protein